MSDEYAPHLVPDSEVPSRARLQVALSSFVIVLVIALSGLTVFIVTRIFDRLTPSIREDLIWKSVHGARELANQTEVALAAGDRDIVRSLFQEHTASEDVLALVAVVEGGTVLERYGDSPETVAQLFAGTPNVARQGPGYLVSWHPAVIEGSLVGKVAMVISTARLEEGERLRRNILILAGIACAAALALTLAFVRFYIGPLIALTLRALGSLRELTTSLEDRVRRRTRELSQSKQELEQMLARLTATQHKLMETSRVAGMAEVATSVLHNVGNVLNSANVSGTLVVDGLRRSKVSSVAKLADLLRAHEADLGEFLTNDERGRRIPGYLGTLAESLEAERQGMLKELEGLAANMNHIKVIINLQQSHAKSTGGVQEMVDLESIVEEAVRFNAVSFDKHKIEIVRDYVPPGRMSVDRHKLFQILMNLLSNARHAIKAGRQPAGRITVRVAARDDQMAEIVISDTGCGIPAENMNKIFVHGFTTKKDGHGFGLHSSALAARDLGGELRCTSDGAGRGATFTITLPRTGRGISLTPPSMPRAS